ncbi:Smr/MutS family protein [Pseudohoeflea coraliihabitans]|uniref:Smr/MutS family protein n=1 Tax=Pseudohoeflea coraliihabitans TaxID=2860393 RepID=A0ABS6WT43_9HYPH|nr:Smr/MutS family protein [Pseudohoeflea sp. DP4N28-3]MBW3099128.1 Smr/MutS family protein [Pseudohoeflea sp. DP4N28-3]
MSAKGRKGLSHDDRVVWDRVTRTVAPLHDAPSPHAAASETMAELMAGQGSKPATPSSKVVRAAPVLTPRSGTRKAETQDHGFSSQPALHPIEKPTWRKIKTGRLAIEARLDLHGLRRTEAYPLLYNFLLEARDRGLRHVLVITGKGRSGGSAGVLRRVIPEWFTQPQFRLLVSGVETSARGHGGEGALYVRLRRRRDINR